MYQIYETENNGYSNSNVKLHSAYAQDDQGLCFGYATLWAYLAQSGEGWESTNPTEDDCVESAAAIHNAMENKVEELADAMLNKPLSKKLQSQGAFNQHITASVKGYDFTLKAFQGREVNLLPTILKNSGHGRSYVVCIGGHWVGVHIMDQAQFFFDANGGLYWTDKFEDFNQTYKERMGQYRLVMKQKMGAYSPFKEKHTAYELTLNSNKPIARGYKAILPTTKKFKPLPPVPKRVATH